MAVPTFCPSGGLRGVDESTGLVFRPLKWGGHDSSSCANMIFFIEAKVTYNLGSEAAKQLLNLAWAPAGDAFR